MTLSPIRVGLIGVGNCASSLIQGVTYYRKNATTVGLMHPSIGGYEAGDLEFVAAFDVDRTKVGLPLHKAITAGQNCTVAIAEPAPTEVLVLPGAVLDGAGTKYRELVDVGEAVPVPGDRARIVAALRDARVEVLVNYLPVGSQVATEFYAGCAIEAGCGFVNSIPVFIARNPAWRDSFRNAGLPLVGDDIKSQVGATIVHRALAQLIGDRGMRMERTYQLNVGGNMDFYNMLEQDRLVSKRQSKSAAVTSVLAEPIDPRNVHIGPSDFVPWLEDRKLAFIRCEATGFGGVPVNIELRMEVWDSPNSAGVVIDAVRAARVALDTGRSGALDEVCAWLMKAPPKPMSDADAHTLMQAFAAQ